MSRVDEALRRQGTGLPSLPGTSAHRLFDSAWESSTGEDEGPVAEGRVNGRADVVPVPADPNMPIQLASVWKTQLATGADSDPHLVEQFRRLAATLHHARLANGLKSVVVTSAMPGDGKTLTAINLALVLAESYRYRVLLVDADLHRPSIPNVVSFTSGCGLSEALRAQTNQKLALVPITERLTLLPAGQPISNSIEALTSPRMQQILDEASTRYDWVVMDSPPAGPTTDARLLARMVGGTLFVVHAGKTQCPDVQRAIDSIGREQILGVILNGVDGSSMGAYYSYRAGPSVE